MTSTPDRIARSATGSSLILSSAAAFIGLCCIGPVAVVVFGVTGAVFLARLEPARPYFIAGASIFMLVTTFFLYLYPLLQKQKVTRNPASHALLGVSFLLILFAVYADDILWYF